MATMPRAVLSDQLEERLRQRRLVAGMFLTYQFEPDFFENQILPLFFDLSASPASKLRLLQLDEALHSVTHGVAVYYDRNGLLQGAGPSRLAIKRISMRPRLDGYIFHSKNVFALVEDLEAGEDGTHSQTLIVATLSANLTRAGWWENVEVCQIEEIQESEFTSLRTDLIGFLNDLERRTSSQSKEAQAPLRAIRSFLRGTKKRKMRSIRGKLHPRFYNGRENVADFIGSVAGDSLQNMNLEIISPFFDEALHKLPLKQLIDRFSPREIRIFLPRNAAGEVTCSQSVYAGIRQLEKNNVFWAKLPDDLLSSGRRTDARPRFVHAKVYRFFHPSSRREVFFTGSVNLTSAAHHAQKNNPRAGNDETAFLYEASTARRPDWWLVPEKTRFTKFMPQTETEELSFENGTDLALRYNWDSGVADAYWNSEATHPSPAWTIKGLGTVLFRLKSLAAQKWIRLPPEAETELHRVLQSTSILTVEEAGKGPAFILVQEEGEHKPTACLLDLTPADILRYWSQLTLSQKTEFLKARVPESGQAEDGTNLLAQAEHLTKEETFFDTFAEIFHDFGNLEQAIVHALPGNSKQAASRLFGQRFDSLPVFLGKVMMEFSQGRGRSLDYYLHFLCARQLLDEVSRTQPDFVREHRRDTHALDNQIATGHLQLQKHLIETGPAEMASFLQWFESWFLKRARPVAAEES